MIPQSSKAMVLEKFGDPLRLRTVPHRSLEPTQVRLRVLACAVCRTDLHLVDGELPNPALPVIPGHEIVGEIVEAGDQARTASPGDRVGVPWLASTCGTCKFCRKGLENLCDRALFHGYTVDGGYAQYCVADHRYCLPIPEGYEDAEAAPLLCAGLIGYRAYRLAGEDIEKLGIYGFGAAAHILAQVAAYRGQEIYAFTRPGDGEGQAFARSLGAVWAGGSDERPPEELDAALLFAPVGSLVPLALQAVRKGGTVVCGGIHMSEIPEFPYDLLWGERILRSVANLTRDDGRAFLDIAARVGVKPTVTLYPLEKANDALDRLRHGRLDGAAVLVP